MEKGIVAYPFDNKMLQCITYVVVVNFIFTYFIIHVGCIIHVQLFQFLHNIILCRSRSISKFPGYDLEMARLMCVALRIFSLSDTLSRQ